MNGSGEVTDSNSDPANPQLAEEYQRAARHLLLHPFTTEERSPEMFRLIRRHESELDRRFTQTLGYRLHVDTDTARLFKTTHIPSGRPLRTASQSARSMRQLEYTMLTLVFAATASGPAVISLRDLIAEVRSCAAEAEIELQGDSTERRATVVALQWMIRHGLVTEMHDHVDAYTSDEDADAILRMRPDRIALMLVPALTGSESVEELFERSQQRASLRQRIRSRLAEDPVLYRSDVTEEEWSELRRRLGDEAAKFDQMFALTIEARAEGVAAVDPSGSLSSQRFPTGGTIGHASLLLIEALMRRQTQNPGGWAPLSEVEELLSDLARANAKRWKSDLVESPQRLTNEVVDFLATMMLCERGPTEPKRSPDDSDPADRPPSRLITGQQSVRLLPAAARYSLDIDPDGDDEIQAVLTLW